jgi:hypothetical protein
MPNPEQAQRFWLKWIDRQYAKVDPSHVKMRPEISEPQQDMETTDDAATGALKNDRPTKLSRLAMVVRNSFTGRRNR